VKLAIIDAAFAACFAQKVPVPAISEAA
jgi:hypothetical protein